MFEKRSFILSEHSIGAVYKAINEAPNGVQVILQEPEKKRTKEVNSYAWAVMLRDFEEQGFINGRNFSKAAWHEYLKAEFLPDEPEDGITLKGYKKWEESPGGNMVNVGSTTQLTSRGFADYLERCFAFGSELQIKFSTMRNL